MKDSETEQKRFKLKGEELRQLSFMLCYEDLPSANRSRAYEGEEHEGTWPEDLLRAQ